MRNLLDVRALGAAALTLAVAYGAVGCGSDDDPTSTAAAPSATEHNDADVAFASDMLQHHAQALSMVDLTLDRPLDPEVVELAEQVRSAQGPEIETFTDWLTEWGEPIPETMRDHSNAGHGGHDVGDSMEGMDTDMPGMMSAEDMTGLQQAEDADFQAMWLEMMIEHHEGAVEMAEAHTDEGRYAPAIELARDIAEGQTAEIAEMQRLLDS
ncbi:DUF305 domain-containing protein [Nocardioides piscis]|uniref:DUF305 domain-containing protein n=1 Tax=Nocardioides piscis TaxID=2714938 RepID=A0A6G7YCK3_9ACTN|nr:DUF305 domain-containing protein [Nocardioides piscis]QIK74406.1 DUF305 domain-containing protein [Nocardioides piscis]